MERILIPRMSRLTPRRLTDFLVVALTLAAAIALALPSSASALFGCGVNPFCMVGKAAGAGISSIAGDAITALAKAVLGALGHAIEWASTLWVGVGTPPVADASGQPTGTVSFLQQNLLVYTTGLAVLSTLIGAGRIAWHEHKSAHARELARFLVTYVLVAGGAAFAASVIIGGADQMAAWFINQADGNSTFSDHLAQVLGLATATASHAGPVGFTAGLAATVDTAVIAIILGILAFLGSVVQIMLMLVRGGMLVLLVGTLPLIAAFSNTEMGLQWFRKACAWLLAFALYKPAAAIIYAVAFDLAGQQGALSLLDGVMMLLLAILALPALMRFLVPATSALAGGRGTGAMLVGAAGAAAMRMPTGAAPVQSTPSAAYDQGSAGSAGSNGGGSGGATGAVPTADGGPGGGANGGPGLSASSGSSGSNGGSGTSGPSGAPGPGSAPAGTPGAAGTAGGGATGSGAAAGAGAATGGVGAAAVIGAQQLAKGAQAAGNAANGAVSGNENASNNDSDGDGPTGAAGKST
jgi:type IV secretion system protein TrbL